MQSFVPLRRPSNSFRDQTNLLSPYIKYTPNHISVLLKSNFIDCCKRYKCGQWTARLDAAIENPLSFDLRKYTFPSPNNPVFPNRHHRKTAEKFHLHYDFESSASATLSLRTRHRLFPHKQPCNCCLSSVAFALCAGRRSLVYPSERALTDFP